ncbi:hypothetical protein [Tessaracoccus massiliensis]|uniref:hypothetical protein n=1 Tax=Tessaracoccus massiliensis TaxID=1522311 RepID=UPI001118B557|nr:hypothetical protein [Tessaracoccus massiliensis]
MPRDWGIRYRTTVPELIGDAASCLEASGRIEEAVELYANEIGRDSYAKFYFANWLFGRGDLQAAREQVSEPADEYPEPALLLGKISLAEVDVSSAHYWAGCGKLWRARRS